MASNVFRFNLNDTSDKTLQMIKADKNWIYHCLPVIALQAPVFKDGVIDILEMVQRLQACKYEHEGSTILGSQILALWKFICGTNRSDIVGDSLTKVPQLSSAVPIVLWAYKQTHGTPYEAWSGNPMVGKILGKDLERLPEMRGWECPWSPDELAVIRNICLTELKRDMRMADTSYKMNKIVGRGREGVAGYNEFDELPKLMKYMVLQTWVYHPSLRKDTMITDWNSWDSLAPSLYKSLTTKDVPTNPLDDIFAGITYKWEAQ